MVYKRSPRREKVLINDRIPFKEVRLVNPKGGSEGVISIEEARDRAEEEGLDLIVVSAKAEPPVCKMMDYGHYKYEKEKQKKQARKGSKSTVIKELKMSPKISEHDYQVRLRGAMKFLKKNYKVKVTVNFRGREMTHTELGRELLERFIKDLDGLAVADNRPKMAGRSMAMVISKK